MKSAGRGSSRLKAVTLLFLLLCAAQSIADGGRRYTVRVTSFPLAAKERIVSFEIQITAGIFRNIANLPPGWNLQIDNDASWNTSVTANIMVGAAALSAEEFKKLHFVIEKSEDKTLDFHVVGKVVVTEAFEKTITEELQSSDFVLTPAK
jgi:hypothetical protein